MLKLINVSKRYGQHEVLKSINMECQRGKIYGIVGENGAGKSTLFRCIAGLEYYNGQIQSEYKPLKNHIGLLETTPTFLSYITGWEYLKLMCIARNIKTEDFDSQNIFNLPLNQYADTYSTGMQKKLALMGILLQQNQIFILDEPFSGVDLKSNLIIHGLLEELRQLNKLVILSSHVFATLHHLCDEILVLSAGKIISKTTKGQFHSLEETMKQDALKNEVAKIRLQ